MEFNDISRLVGRTVRLEDSSDGDSAVYQGKLEKHLMPGWYVIREPLKIYPDGRREQEDGWRMVGKRDFKEGRVTSLPH